MSVAPRTVGDALAGVEPRVSGINLPENSIEFRGERVRGVYKMADLHVTRQPTERSLRRFAAIPEGGNRFDLPEGLKTPGWRKHTTGSRDVMGRLRWDKPSVTIRTEFFKPEKGRYLHRRHLAGISCAGGVFGRCDDRGDGLCGGSADARLHVRVKVRGDCGRGVAEAVGDDFHLDAGLQGKGEAEPAGPLVADAGAPGRSGRAGRRPSPASAPRSCGHPCATRIPPACAPWPPPMRTRGWLDLSRIDPAFVLIAAAVTEEADRGFVRPLLITRDEVVLAAAVGRPARSPCSTQPWRSRP